MVELVEVIGRLPYASNATLLAADADGDLWVYKPVDGEEPLWDFPWKTLAAREVLTFEVSDAMGLDLVPETVMATGEFGPGSAQRFLDEDTDFDPRPLFRPPMDPILQSFAVLDVVTNNADRKVGHILRDKGTGRLWAIDNGLTFHPTDKLRTVVWGFAGSAIPPELVESLRRLDDGMESLTSRIADLLSHAEAHCFAERVRGLLIEPVFPQPPEDRPPMPWPVW